MHKTLLYGGLLALSTQLMPAAQAQNWAEIYTSPIQIWGGEESISKQSIDIGSIKTFGGKTYFHRRVCHYRVKDRRRGKLKYCTRKRADSNSEVFDCPNKTYLFDNTHPRSFKKRMLNGEWWGYYEIRDGRRGEPLKLENYAFPKKEENDKYYESIYRLVCNR